jgi:hypothetical protein
MMPSFGARGFFTLANDPRMRENLKHPKLLSLMPELHEKD